MLSTLSRLRLFVVLGLFTGALTFVGTGLVSSPVEAVQATAGSAKYKAIEWISWGRSAGEEIPNGGRTVTERSTIAGKELAITCSVSNIAHPAGAGTGALLQAYRSGSWQGDGFDDLYNRGGTGTDNQMVVGLANRLVSNTVTFTFSCSATLDGEAMPLAGLVMADAESSAGNLEHVGATIPRTNAQTGEPTRWRILDRVRSANCTDSATARRTEAGTVAAGANRLELYGPASYTCESSSRTSPSPSAIAFMENASSATDVTVAGGGRSAIALGVALDLDFGDAPQSYQDAVAATQLSYAGGEVPLAQGTFPSDRGVDLFNNFNLATVTPPTPRLGAVTDGELAQPYSADATRDDNQPVAGPDDEDSVTLPAEVVLQPGGTFSTDVACTRSGALGGRLAGWIDWNVDGAFQADERSREGPTCAASGATTLTWDLPTDPLPEGGAHDTVLRLRVVGTADRLLPTGISNAGEVEDHRLRITTAPRLEVVKKVAGRTDAADQFLVDATGAGLGDGEIRASTTGAGTQAVSERRRVRADQRYTISDTMAPGSQNQISDYTTAISCVDLAADNAAVEATGTGPQWQLTGLTEGQIVRCTVTNTAKPAALNVAKEAIDVAGPDAEGVYIARYRISVSNTGPQATSYTLSDRPRFADNLRVLQASWRRTDVSGAGPGSALGEGPFELATAQRIARDVTHSYELDVVFRFTDRTAAAACAGPGTGLFNEVALGTGEESGTGVDNNACLEPPAVPETGLALDKQAGEIVDLDGNGPDVGDRIDYTFVLTNSGELTLRELTIDDDRVRGLTCPTTILAPGASTTCTGQRVLTQADIDAGSVENTASASGLDPDENPVPSPEDSTSTTIAQRSALLLDKQAAAPFDANGNGSIEPGDTISYTFVVTNTGRTTVREVEVTDTLLAQVTCPAGELAPGESATCTGTPYVITQDDMEAGTVLNVADAAAEGPTGRVVSNQDETVTNLLTRAGLELVKEADLIEQNGNDRAEAGESVRYTFTVRNSGTVRVTQVRIVDEMLAEARVSITCAASALEPGEETTCSATYRVRSADIGRDLVNVATATGEAVTGEVVSNEDDAVVPTAGVLPHEEGGSAGDPDDGGGDGGPDGPGGLLPRTGGFAGGWVAAGAGLLVAGLLLLLRGRRSAPRGKRVLR